MSHLNAEDHLKNISINDLWETPYGMLEKFCSEHKLPIPTLDVCGTLRNRKCQKVLVEPYGLKIPWDEDWFGNFPYSEMEFWMKKAFDDHKTYNKNGIVLAFNKSGNKWYHKYVYNKEEDIYYAKVIPIKGRVHFLIDGKPYYYWSKKDQKYYLGSAPYDSAWVVYLKDIPYFKLEPKIFPKRF